MSNASSLDADIQAQLRTVILTDLSFYDSYGPVHTVGFPISWLFLSGLLIVATYLGLFSWLFLIFTSQLYGLDRI